MHHHTWYDWLHIPLAMIAGSFPVWIGWIDTGGHVLTIFAPYLAATVLILQIWYLARKHRRLGK